VNKKNKVVVKLSLVFSSFLLPGISFGQTDAEVLDLEEFVAEGIASELSVMPTARPIESMFGAGRSILDTPRSISVITPEMMAMAGIDKVEELGRLSPGVFSPSVYGVPGVPTIRGDFAEVYQNGQRRRFQRLAYSPSFSAVEAMDIVKGTGNVVYGPATRGGGIVNMVLKRPLLVPKTTLSARLGDLVLSSEGGSYLNTQYTIDTSAPINDEWGYRIVAGFRESDSVYRNVFDNLQEIYTAFAYTPNEDTRWDLNFSFESYQNNEALGFNRPTQAFINSGSNYIAGPATPGFAGEEAVVDAATARLARVRTKDSLTHPDSGGEAKRFGVQSIFTREVSDTLTFKNSTFYEYLEARKWSPHSFSNYSPGNHLFDNRSELVINWNDPALDRNETVLGLAYRYDAAESYIDFIDEVFNIYDLTQDPRTFSNPFYPDFWLERGVVGQIPGQGPTYRSQVSGARKSTLNNFGLFVQQEVDVNEWLTLLGGARGDYTFVDARRPQLLDADGNPLPTLKATDQVFNPSGNASVIVRPMENVSTYVSYNYVRNIQGDDFNALRPIVVDGKAIVDQRELEIENEMIELGAKTALFDNKVFLGAAVFWQDRVRTTREGDKIELNVHGVEGELVYQPTVRFNLFANASYTWARQPNSRPFTYTKNYLDAFPPEVIVDGAPGTGVGAPNFGIPSPFAAGDYRLWQLPSVIVNVGSTYVFENGFGVSGNAQWIDSYPLNPDGSLMIPSTVEFGGAVFYRFDGWEVRLNVFNIFDERIITPVSAASGNDMFMVEKPRRAALSFKYTF
jgi:outer membrane receptor protein involved in Fe transport